MAAQARSSSLGRRRNVPVPLSYQSVDIKPLSGPMDNRSTPDAVPIGFWRWRQNVAVFDQGKACRRPGWPKYRTERVIYNNEDLHDQLLSLQTYYSDRQVPYSPQSDVSVYPPGDDINGIPFCPSSQLTRTTARQPLAFLFNALTTTNDRKLLAGTQNRLYSFNEAKGNWRIIADAYGGDPGSGLKRYWYAAQINDAVILTNNYDPPLVHILDQPVFGCAMQAVSTIPSLDGIGLTKAAVVAAWKGTIFLANVEQDSARVSQRVVWSCYELPTNFTPGTAGSNGTAGFQDLSYGDEILAMVPLADVLLIYTTRSIWQVEFVGGEQTFIFQERYREQENGEGCLAFKRTIVSTGQEHIYLGRDGIYVYNLFLPRPDRMEWIHRGTAELFKTIDDANCEGHVGAFYSSNKDPSTKEYWISWVETGQIVPRRTLVFNTLYQSSDLVDHGFTAFANHAPDDRGTILDFLIERGLCTPAELAAQADLQVTAVKEGGYCDNANQPVAPGSLPDRNMPIWTNNSVEIGGKAVENLYQPTPDPDSLCALFGNLTIEDLCQECNKGALLLMAAADDWCIKQYSPKNAVYYREVCTGFLPCGTWRRDGYESILRTGAQDYGYPREDKNCRALELEYSALQLQELPSALLTRIAYSAQAVDSNDDASGRCAIVWRPLRTRDLECVGVTDGEGQKAAGTRPNKTMNWTFLYTGRYFYFELKVSGVNGGACFSRLTGDVRQMLRSANS